MSKPAPDRCPICRKPVVAEHAPFCSAACRDRDLIAWLDGNYTIPGPPADDEQD